jgi:DNA-binding MarR family transcriptional regulator
VKGKLVARTNSDVGLVSSTSDLLRALLEAGRSSVPSLARRAGLSHSELAALEVLTREDWGPSELARHLGVTTAAASGIVDRLVERGHVHRVPHPEDRRRRIVELTPDGRAEVIGHLMPMFVQLAALDASLSDADRAVIDDYLTRARAAVRAVL